MAILFAGKAVSQTTDSCHEVLIKSVAFEKNSVRLSAYAKKQLDSSLLLINAHPFCRVSVSGGSWGCELCAQRDWDRVDAVVKYLVVKGIAKERMIFSYGESDAQRVVYVSLSSNEGPFEVPAPHPGVRKYYSKTRDVYIDGHVLPLEH